MLSFHSHLKVFLATAFYDAFLAAREAAIISAIREACGLPA
ncbi:MAG TPA: hypothetical protein VGY56_13975 [Verrucomicrobiae bacterium]|nr:hypothetical protein [Verrucomicrobiae bacterium]